MPETYNIQVRLGNKKITLFGATSFEITEGSEAPKMQSRAPTGGKTVFTQADSFVNAIVHSVPETKQEEITP